MLIEALMMSDGRALLKTAGTRSAMIVCTCNVLSDHEIRDVVTEPRQHPLSARQVYDCLGCSIRCGRCPRAVKRIIADSSMMAGYEKAGFAEAGKVI